MRSVLNDAEVIYVIMHLLVHDENSRRDGSHRLYHLVPEWAHRTVQIDVQGAVSFSLEGRCNETHRVIYKMYHGGIDGPDGAVHVYQAWSNDPAPQLIGLAQRQINLLHTMEMYANVGFDYADGFVGTVGLDRQDPQSLIWRPVMEPRYVWSLGQVRNLGRVHAMLGARVTHFWLTIERYLCGCRHS